MLRYLILWVSTIIIGERNGQGATGTTATTLRTGKLGETYSHLECTCTHMEHTCKCGHGILLPAEGILRRLTELCPCIL